MAALTTQQKTEVLGNVMREFNAWLNGVEFEVPQGTSVKDDLMAVVTYTDNWLDTNQANFMGSIPEPGKTQLTNKAKAHIFAAVWLKRYAEFF